MMTGVFEKGWHPISSIPSSTELRVGRGAATRVNEQISSSCLCKAVGTMKKVFASAGVSVIPATQWRSREQAQRKISGFQRFGNWGVFASAGDSVIPATQWRSREQAQRKISGFQRLGKLGWHPGGQPGSRTLRKPAFVWGKHQLRARQAGERPGMKKKEEEEEEDGTKGRLNRPVC
jgi:hypothetical protein